MEVNKELIEKYHRNECSPEEALAVEAWLLDDDIEGESDLSMVEEPAIQKAMMWENIRTSLPEEPQVHKKKKLSLWLAATAACITLALFTFTIGYIPADKQCVADKWFEVDNTSALKAQHFENDEYLLSVGPGTSARIDNEEGIIHFTGSMIIRPQRDIKLSFGLEKQKESFKSGETYILLDEEHGDGRVTIVNQRQLMDISPVLKKRIISEFNI